jgi:hypothetical protein
MEYLSREEVRQSLSLPVEMAGDWREPDSLLSLDLALEAQDEKQRDREEKLLRADLATNSDGICDD